MNWNEEQPEKKKAHRYLTRERKGQLPMPGLEAPVAQRKRKGARESAQKKLNKLPPRSRR
jgi:hypothetical protein